LSFLFPSSTITLEAALRDASSTNVKARLRAVTALGDVDELTERRRAVAALTVALDDDHPGVRAEAVASLGQMGELAPVPALIARLDDGDSGVRQQAAIALGGLRDRAGFAPLAEALRAGPADLRYQAASSLAEIDAVAAYEPLVAALGDRDSQVVGAAAVALGSLGEGRAAAHLVPLLTHAERDIRFEAAWALAELGDARGRAELWAQLGGPASSSSPAMTARRRLEISSAGGGHPGRALEALESIAKLARLAAETGAKVTEERRALARLLTSAGAPAEALIVAARHVLSLLELEAESDPSSAADRQAAQQVLLAALSARKDPLRGLAVEQLAAVGGEWALPALEELAQSRRGRLLAEPLAETRTAIAARSAHVDR
jgi:HEAT repeat protein